MRVGATMQIAMGLIVVCLATTQIRFSGGYPTIDDIRGKFGTPLPIDGNWISFQSKGMSLQPPIVRFERGVMFVLSNPYLQQGRVLATDFEPVSDQQAFAGYRAVDAADAERRYVFVIESPTNMGQYRVHPTNARNDGGEEPLTHWVLLTAENTSALTSLFKPHDHAFGPHFFVTNPNAKQ
jgi:hypothetical protein